MQMNTPRLQLEKRLYTARASATGGRAGHARTADGSLDLKMSLPKELGGDGAGVNPEQLFACGYAACFGTGLATIAAKRSIVTGPVTITVDVSLGPVGQGFGLAVELLAELPELPRQLAEELVRATHEVCPYSQSTRGNIAVDLQVKGA
jgi:Ohr subfamily peroxiredoxin